MPQAINCYLSPIYSETNGTSDAAICLTHDARSRIYRKWDADDRFVT